MIDELLNSSEVQRTDLNLIAFSAGPGSFTGVRLGASVAQGIAFGLGLNVVAVPTSAAMALRVHKLQPGRQTCTLVRWSRRGWFYVAQFHGMNNSMECLHEDELMSEDDVPTGPDVVRDDHITLSALTVLEFALSHRAQSVPPEQALPLYLAGDSPYQVKPR